MLADKRSRAMTANFAGQWLYLRNLPGLTRTPRPSPTSTTICGRLPPETEMFFDSVVREDRSALDLLNAIIRSSTNAGEATGSRMYMAATFAA